MSSLHYRIQVSSAVSVESIEVLRKLFRLKCRGIIQFIPFFKIKVMKIVGQTKIVADILHKKPTVK